jgi:hypothetical protein
VQMEMSFEGNNRVILKLLGKLAPSPVIG